MVHEEVFKSQPFNKFYLIWRNIRWLRKTFFIVFSMLSLFSFIYSLSIVFLCQKSQSNGPEKEKDGVIQNFKRTLSKKEKKKEKKREKEFARIPDGDEQTFSREDG